MNIQSRVHSIVNAQNLDSSITGFNSFSLSELNSVPESDIFDLPNNIRLGHLAEKAVSQRIKLSKNYKLRHENIQIIEGKNTIGEIDFILEEIESKQVIHMELAYKFYLYDPSISHDAINNWIGPNRNDSLKEKLDKLKSKQFPLLYHPSAKSKLFDFKINEVKQALCFLASLFIPYEFEEKLNPNYEKAIKGYYLDMKTFIRLDTSSNKYYIPSKKEWGMDPSENNIWNDFSQVEGHISTCMDEHQALLCWQKHGDFYSEFFIVWW